MGSWKNDGLHVQEYVYDFAVDGGAASVVNLAAKAGVDPLPIGAVVKGVSALVVTSVTSGGSATCEWGSTADTDGYSGTAIAKATLVAGYNINSEEGAGALTWDNSNDCVKSYEVTDAATGAFMFLSNVAALTAGKIVFTVQYTLQKTA